MAGDQRKILAKDDEHHEPTRRAPSKSNGGQDMLRSVLLVATVAVMTSATAVMADNKTDCQKGLAMIKAELKKIATLRKALSDVETEVVEEDWSECMDYIKTARAALSK